MISTRDLKGQIDELSQQNQFLTEQLIQIKMMLQNLDSGNSGDKQEQSGGKSSQGRNSNQSQNQNENQNGSYNSSGMGNSGQGQGGNSFQGGSNGNNAVNNNGGHNGSGGNSNYGNNPISEIANDFLKLKGLTGNLEMKMQQYTSNQSGASNGSSLTEGDIVNLILTMMNGMIDWTVDYVSTMITSQNGQQQMN